MAAHDFKSYKPIIAALQQQGFTVTQTTSGHFKAVPPDRDKPLVHFSTSADTHAYKNILRQLRQSGFVWGDEGDTPLSEPAEVPREDEEHVDVDELFLELKHAREYAVLAREELKTAHARLAEAEAEVERTKVEVERSEDVLARVKRRFDAAFAAQEVKVNVA